LKTRTEAIKYDRDGGTLLAYDVEAQIGGKLAQLWPAPDQVESADFCRADGKN